MSTFVIRSGLRSPLKTLWNIIEKFTRLLNSMGLFPIGFLIDFVPSNFVMSSSKLKESEILENKDFLENLGCHSNCV